MPSADDTRQDLVPTSLQPPVEDPNAHELTLEFWRFLTDEEFRTVVQQVRKHVPHIRLLHARGVRVSDEQAADAVDSQADSADTREKAAS